MKAKENQLEQEINASSAVVAWEAMQTASMKMPMLDLNIDLNLREDLYKADIQPALKKGLPLSSQPSSQFAISPVEKNRETASAGSQKDKVQSNTPVSAFTSVPASVKPVEKTEPLVVAETAPTVKPSINGSAPQSNPLQNTDTGKSARQSNNQIKVSEIMPAQRMLTQVPETAAKTLSNVETTFFPMDIQPAQNMIAAATMDKPNVNAETVQRTTSRQVEQQTLPENVVSPLEVKISGPEVTRSEANPGTSADEVHSSSVPVNTRKDQELLPPERESQQGRVIVETTPEEPIMAVSINDIPRSSAGAVRTAETTEPEALTMLVPLPSEASANTVENSGVGEFPTQPVSHKATVYVPRAESEPEITPSQTAPVQKKTRTEVKPSGYQAGDPVSHTVDKVIEETSSFDGDASIYMEVKASPHLLNSKPGFDALVVSTQTQPSLDFASVESNIELEPISVEVKVDMSAVRLVDGVRQSTKETSEINRLPVDEAITSEPPTIEQTFGSVIKGMAEMQRVGEQNPPSAPETDKRSLEVAKHPVTAQPGMGREFAAETKLAELGNRAAPAHAVQAHEFVTKDAETPVAHVHRDYEGDKALTEPASRIETSDIAPAQMPSEALSRQPGANREDVNAENRSMDTDTSSINSALLPGIQLEGIQEKGESPTGIPEKQIDDLQSPAQQNAVYGTRTAEKQANKPLLDSARLQDVAHTAGSTIDPTARTDTPLQSARVSANSEEVIGESKETTTPQNHKVISIVEKQKSVADMSLGATIPSETYGERGNIENKQTVVVEPVFSRKEVEQEKVIFETETTSPATADKLETDKASRYSPDEIPDSFMKYSEVDSTKFGEQSTLSRQDPDIRAHQAIDNSVTSQAGINQKDVTAEAKKLWIQDSVAVEAGAPKKPATDIYIDREVNHIHTEPVSNAETPVLGSVQTSSARASISYEANEGKTIVDAAKVEQQDEVFDKVAENLKPADQPGNASVDATVLQFNSESDGEQSLSRLDKNSIPLKVSAPEQSRVQAESPANAVVADMEALQSRTQRVEMNVGSAIVSNIDDPNDPVKVVDRPVHTSLRGSNQMADVQPGSNQQYADFELETIEKPTQTAKSVAEDTEADTHGVKFTANLITAAQIPDELESGSQLSAVNLEMSARSPVGSERDDLLDSAGRDSGGVVGEAKKTAPQNNQPLSIAESPHINVERSVISETLSAPDGLRGTLDASTQILVAAEAITIPLDQPEINQVNFSRDIENEKAIFDAKVVSQAVAPVIEPGHTAEEVMIAPEKGVVTAEDEFSHQPAIQTNVLQVSALPAESDIQDMQLDISLTKTSFENRKDQTITDAFQKVVDISQIQPSAPVIPSSRPDIDTEEAIIQTVTRESSSTTISSDVPKVPPSKAEVVFEKPALAHQHPEMQANSSEFVVETSQPLPDYQVMSASAVMDAESVSTRLQITDQRMLPPTPELPEAAPLQTGMDQDGWIADGVDRQGDASDKRVNISKLDLDLSMAAVPPETGPGMDQERPIIHTRSVDKPVDLDELVVEVAPPNSDGSVGESESASPQTGHQATRPAQTTVSSDTGLSLSEVELFQAEVYPGKLVIEPEYVEKEVRSSPAVVSPTAVKPAEETASTITVDDNFEIRDQSTVPVGNPELANRQTISERGARTIINEASLPASFADPQETPVPGQTDALTNADFGKQDLKADQTSTADEKVLSVENQFGPNEKLESASIATNSIKESVMIGLVEKGPTVQVNPHAVEVVQQVMRQLNGRLKSGPTSMHLQLNPESLGTIDVEVVRDAQGVSVMFVAEQASTGKLLETQLGQLRQSLVDSGIQLSGLNIGQHSHSGQEGGFGHQNAEFAHHAKSEAFPSRSSPKESPRAERVTGQTGEVDYLI